MTEAEELVIDTPALRLAARAWGPPGAPPVLALHGWLDNAASFDGVAPLLPGVRLIALDLPGHGHSEHRARAMPYHFLDYVADVVNAAHALRLERYALLGHSLGAGIASFVAAVVPQQISRLALIEGIGPFSAEHERGPAQLLQSIEEMRALAAKQVPSYDDLAAAARARAAASDFDFDAALTLTRRGTAIRDGRATWRADPKLRVKSPGYLSEEQVLAYLRAIHAPTLLLRAERGLLRTRPQLERRYACIAALELRDLPGGHHLHLQQPQATAAALEAFLGSA